MLDTLYQRRIVVLGAVHARAHGPRNHRISWIGLQRAARIVRRARQPRLNVVVLQDRRHALLRVVDLGHERIGRHRDNRAALKYRPVLALRCFPQPGEPEHRLIGARDAERRLAAVVVDVPLVEARGRQKATLGALSGAAPRRAICQFLDRGVDRAVLRWHAPGKERHQAPPHHQALALVIRLADHRHRLRRGYVVAAVELPAQQVHEEIALGFGNVGADVAATH
jgi:hypothetical protein